MGVQHSHLHPVHPADKAAHRAAEKTLREAKNKLAHQHRVLLLGSGDSGKSTVVKQMRLIHSKHFTPEEVETFRQLVFANLTDGMRLILTAMRELASPRVTRNTQGRTISVRDSYDLLLEDRNLKYATMIEDAPDIKDDEPFPPAYEEAFRALWADEGVCRAKARGNEVALPENLSYFFSCLPRLFSPDYVPTTSDILRVRVRTIGISELTFRPARNPASELVVIDVGGQKNERRKWIHCFEDVSCVIYLASLSGYNQCLAEDRCTNQMDDALILWSQICLSPWFKNASLILFLNKEDLFREKIATSPIKKTFPDYDGPPDDVTAGKAFFKRRFMKLARVSDRAAYNTLVLGNDARTARHIVGLGCNEDNHRSVKAVPSLVFGTSSKWTTAAFPENTSTTSIATTAPPTKTTTKSLALARMRSGRKHRTEPNTPHRKPTKAEKTAMLREKENATRSEPALPPQTTRTMSEKVGSRNDGWSYSAQRQIFAHFTNATDTALLRVVMGAVEDISVRTNLAEQHLL